MIKTVLNIEGMMCHNCEAHMNEAIKLNFDVEKVESDFENNETVVSSKEPLNELKLKVVVMETGYELKGISRKEL